MKRAIFSLLTGLLVLASGCGVPESDYQKVVSERDALESNLINPQKENTALKDELLALRNNNKSLEDQIQRLEDQVKRIQDTASSRPAPSSSPPSAPPPTEAVTEQRFYEVQKGDTLWSISRRTGVPLDTLRELNDMEGSQIRVGQRLRLAR